jgi:glycosyltransferase involved in cell wall biosynthesis
MFPRTALEKKLIPLGVCKSFYKGLIEDLPESDIVHTNGLWMLPTVYPAWAIRKIRRYGGDCRTKLVISSRGALAPWALRKGWLKKKIFGLVFQNRVLRNADMFHATSEKEYHEIRAAGYWQPVALVPIGMDLPKFENFNAEKQRGGEAERLRKMVFFGRLHKVKGVGRLVRAWEEVAREGWELVIAGPDCGMLEELKLIVAERKLPRVSFVGEINGQAKYEFLANADIYVLPSDTENFGVTVAEALVSGTPVIASQGTPWQGLERERCGRWVPIGVEPLAAALKEMMSMSDEERATMGARGREWIRRDFSWKGIGAKMKAAYEWLLAPEKVEKPEFVISG